MIKERTTKQKLTQEEVIEHIEKARLGNERSFEILLKLVEPEFKNAQKNKFVFGNDEDDNYQECSMMLMNALVGYDPERSKAAKNSFNYYVRMLCNGQLVSLIHASKRHKNYTLNAALANSLDAVVHEDSDGSTYHLYDAIPSGEELLSEKMEKKQYTDMLRVKVYEHLTDLEKQVFNLHLEDYSYAQIAERLETDTKSVDNAIQRVKNKIPSIMEKEIMEFESSGGYKVERKKPKARKSIPSITGDKKYV